MRAHMSDVLRVGMVGYALMGIGIDKSESFVGD